MKNGWQWKPLGEVCKTGSGGTPLKEKKEYYEGGTIPWLMSGEVSQGEVREATRFITQKGLENSAARIFPKDTVLVAMYGATAGQVGILRFEAATNQAVCGILPNKQFVPEFLFYLLLSKKDELVAQATGNAQPNISQIKIKNTGIPALPLPDQQRIVDILDESFAGIATAKVNAEKNLQNARALFESHLDATLTGRREEWCSTVLGNVCERVTVGHVGITSPHYREKGVLFLRTQNVTKTGLQLDTACFITSEFHATLKKSQVQPGDVLMSRVITDEVTCALIPPGLGPTNCANVVLVRPGPKVIPEYLIYYIRSREAQRHLLSRKVGSAQLVVNTTVVKMWPFDLPPLSQQRSIVATLDGMNAETNRLESIYRQKLVALDELKKSLLHQAFTGEL